MSKPLHQERLTAEGAFSRFGRLFVNQKTAAVTDLSGVRLLRCAVDTVRQMYRGQIIASIFDLFEAPGIVEFGGYYWHSSRVGRDSGYQYKLQNNDLGIIMLIKNFNVKAEDTGPHLKIELSPHFIEYHSPDQLQNKIDQLASLVLVKPQQNQCAVHIALDVQGWRPQADTVARMQCRSRKIRDISGVSSLEWAANASVYGENETFMFGSAAGLQLSIYNKTKQAKATDKLDFWRTLWRQAYADLDTPLYSQDDDVWRIEMRFHHSVVEQFAQGSFNTDTGEFIGTKTFAELAGHLQGLWEYGFDAFKLLDGKGVYDAAWSLFCHDAVVVTGADCISQEHEYKRHYKTASGFSGKNIELFLGNFVSIIARERIGATRAHEQLKQFDGYAVIVEYFENKGLTERDLYCWLRDKLTERTIRWGVAV